MATIGSHCLLDMYGCPPDLIDDADAVCAALREAVIRSNSTLLHEVAHRFEPQGVTAIGLLAESHISIHTWPELRYAAADVFTCGDSGDPQRACEFLAEALRAERFELRRIARGVETAATRPARLPLHVAISAGDR